MSDSTGISNLETERITKNSNNDDLVDNFVGVFSSDKMNKFIDFHGLMKEKSNAKYPFLISNTNRAGTTGTHWWGIVDIHPRSELFFHDLFGIDGLKNFIIQDDQKIAEKILTGIEKTTRTDNKLTLVKINFSMKNYNALLKKASEN